MSFDSLAPFYSTLETLVFGNALQRARSAFISELTGCQDVLVVGEGNGRFLAAVLAANHNVQVTCVEQSAAMIELARRRIADSPRVHFINERLERAELPKIHDAVVTNFFLDCFNESELSAIVQKLAANAASDARWIIAEFTASRGKRLVALMYAFFRFTTRITGSCLPNYAPLLERHGFRREARRLFYGGIVCAELWKRS